MFRHFSPPIHTLKNQISSIEFTFDVGMIDESPVFRIQTYESERLIYFDKEKYHRNALRELVLQKIIEILKENDNFSEEKYFSQFNLLYAFMNFFQDTRMTVHPIMAEHQGETNTFGAIQGRIKANRVPY